MRLPVPVNLDAATDPGVVAKQRSELATLPVSLTEGGRGSPLALVDGRASKWPEIAADLMRLGARGLFIDRPSVKTGPDAIRALADETEASGVTVAVNGIWFAAPAVSELSRVVKAEGGVAMIDGIIESPDGFALCSGELALEHVMIVQEIAGLIDGVQLSSATNGGYTVVGRYGRASTVLCGVRTASVPPRLKMSVHTPTLSAYLKLVADAAARPAELRVVDGSGEQD